MPELHVNYEGLELLIKSRTLDDEFNNDFEIYRLTKNGEVMLMTVKERCNEAGYCVEALPQVVLERDCIEKMIRSLFAPLASFPNAKLVIKGV